MDEKMKESVGIVARIILDQKFQEAHQLLEEAEMKGCLPEYNENIQEMAGVLAHTILMSRLLGYDRQAWDHCGAGYIFNYRKKFMKRLWKELYLGRAKGEGER